MPSKPKTQDETPIQPTPSSDEATNDLARLEETPPQPGDPGMVSATRPVGPEEFDPGDPTKFGIRPDLRPLNTRSAGDASAGVAESDKFLTSGDPRERKRDNGASDGGASIEVEDGKRGVPEPDVDGMTDEQCKSFLLAYGVDAPVAQAKNVLKATILRAKAAQKK